jgi:hypothetical protein
MRVSFFFRSWFYSWIYSSMMQFRVNEEENPTSY